MTFLGLARTLVGVLISILVSSAFLTESTCPSLMLAALQEHTEFSRFKKRSRELKRLEAPQKNATTRCSVANVWAVEEGEACTSLR